MDEIIGLNKIAKIFTSHLISLENMYYTERNEVIG